MRRARYLILLAFFLVACNASTPPEPAQVTSPAPPDLVPKTSPTAAAQPIPQPSPATATASVAIPTISPTPLPEQPIAATAILSAQPVQNFNFPDPQLVEWRVFASVFERPVYLTHAGDGSGRLYVVEQAGMISLVQNGAALDPPFLDIRQRVGSEGNEQGLLGLAFHPEFIQNGYFYVNYTDLNGDTVIARYQATSPTQADPGSAHPLLKIAQPYRNHNGGMLAFGPDGLLYIGLGDGGSAGDPLNNAQSLQSLLGKILRVDVNSAETYNTPADNLFHSGQLPEVWAYGLRNPWRFSFDRQNGDLYIGDVGQNQWEEISYLSAGASPGANFGWRYLEGTHAYTDEALPVDSTLIPPIAEYSHAEGCSVTGGYVYRGALLPEWQGIYFYGDFCSGFVGGLLRDEQGGWIQKTLFQNLGFISSFGEDEQGEIYLVDLDGQVLRLER